MQYLYLILMIVVIQETFPLNPDILKYDEWIKDAETRVKKQKADEKRRSEYEMNKDTYIHDKRETNHGGSHITRERDVVFRYALLDGKIVVDKTRFISKLLDPELGGQFIILRPYRFGKSFFLTTLRAFFQGDKDLFCSTKRRKMDICYDTNVEWESHPIWFMNFMCTDGSLREGILTSISTFAKSWGVDIEPMVGKLDEMIFNTFDKIYSKSMKKLVILVDEYDYPVMRNYFDNETEAKSNERTLHDFFGALKGCGPFIHFMFIVGAMKVTTTGATQNLLKDLTWKDEFSDLIGFTKKEILDSYKIRLAEIVRDKKLNNIDELFERFLTPAYDSYKFSRYGVSVYNPLSVTKFLSENPPEAKPYWAETVVNRSFLKNTVEKFSNAAMQLLFGSQNKITGQLLEDKLDHKNIMVGDETELAKILYQYGFLTLKQGSTSNEYLLGKANEEAEILLKSGLVEKLKKVPTRKMEDLLEMNEFEEFIEVLEKALADFLGDDFYRYEIQYEITVSMLMEIKDDTKFGLLQARKHGTNMTEYPIGSSKRIDYVKKFRQTAVIFFMKRYSLTDHKALNITLELMRCNSVYVKQYAYKFQNENVKCVVIVFYTKPPAEKEDRSSQKKTNNNNEPRLTGYKFIKDWAALQWFRVTKTVKVYNLRLSDEQVKEVASYAEMDQKEKPSY